MLQVFQIIKGSFIIARPVNCKFKNLLLLLLQTITEIVNLTLPLNQSLKFGVDSKHNKIKFIKRTLR